MPIVVDITPSNAVEEWLKLKALLENKMREKPEKLKKYHGMLITDIFKDILENL